MPVFDFRFTRGDLTITVSTDATAEFLRRAPKTDLHCHLIGTVRASTFAELARREKLELPADPS